MVQIHGITESNLHCGLKLFAFTFCSSIILFCMAGVIKCINDPLSLSHAFIYSGFILLGISVATFVMLFILLVKFYLCLPHNISDNLSLKKVGRLDTSQFSNASNMKKNSKSGRTNTSKAITQSRKSFSKFASNTISQTHKIEQKNKQILTLHSKQLDIGKCLVQSQLNDVGKETVSTRSNFFESLPASGYNTRNESPAIKIDSYNHINQASSSPSYPNEMKMPLLKFSPKETHTIEGLQAPFTRDSFRQLSLISENRYNSNKIHTACANIRKCASLRLFTNPTSKRNSTTGDLLRNIELASDDSGVNLESHQDLSKINSNFCTVELPNESDYYMTTRL